MLINHRAIWAYGYKVGPDWQIIDNICEKYGVFCVDVGDGRTGDIERILTTEKCSRSSDKDLWVQQVPELIPQDNIERLRSAYKKFAGKEPEDDPKPYMGLYIY